MNRIYIPSPLSHLCFSTACCRHINLSLKKINLLLTFYSWSLDIIIYIFYQNNLDMSKPPFPDLGKQRFYVNWKNGLFRYNILLRYSIGEIWSVHFRLCCWRIEKSPGWQIYKNDGLIQWIWNSRFRNERRSGQVSRPLCCGRGNTAEIPHRWIAYRHRYGERFGYNNQYEFWAYR